MLSRNIDYLCILSPLLSRLGCERVSLRSGKIANSISERILFSMLLCTQDFFNLEVRRMVSAEGSCLQRTK